MPILRRAINIAGTRLYDPSMAAGDGVFADTTYAGGGRYAGLHKSGVKGNSLREGEVSGSVLWLPPPVIQSPYARGYVLESFPGMAFGVSGGFTIGVIQLLRCTSVEADTIGNMVVGIASAGVGLVSCFAGVYQGTTTLTRIAQTADLSSVWQAAGKVKSALSGGSAVIAMGDAWIALLVGQGSTTAPTMPRGTQTNLPNVANGENTGATAQYATFGSALTALPATITAASVTATPISYWAAATH